MYVDWIFIIPKKDFVQNIVKYIFNASPLPCLSLSLSWFYYLCARKFLASAAFV